MSTLERRVELVQIGSDLGEAVRQALDKSGILARVGPGTRVALKPNLTYPHYKQGVTTSPEVVRQVILALRERTDKIAVVESDGGYGSWTAQETFDGHGLPELCRELGAELVNLCDEDREVIAFPSGGRIHHLPLPSRLLHHTDLFITLPVPKVHAMTGLTLAHKNQWGCIPDNMRLRRHFIFDDAIVAINRALKPAVLADGTWFLDESGPMDGTPVKMDLIIGASDPGSFDRYVSELMGFSHRRVSHMRRAVALGEMPERLEDVAFNLHPSKARTRVFRLERTPRNYIALLGFRSRFMTWFGYESWFGRVVLHGVLYAIVGKPVKPGSPA